MHKENRPIYMQFVQDKYFKFVFKCCHFHSQKLMRCAADGSGMAQKGVFILKTHFGPKMQQLYFPDFKPAQSCGCS